MAEKIVGETIQLKATFDTAPVKPVKINVRDKDGLSVDGSNMTEESSTVFTFDYTIANSGTHFWDAKSADNAIEQKTFEAAVRKTTS